MSTVSGLITRKKKGRTISKLKIANKKTSAKKTQPIPPAKAAEFIAKLKSLARQYNITIQNVKLGSG